MNWLVYHIASGQAFFSGITFILLGIYVSTRRSKLWQSVTFLACFMGVLAVALSSTPLPEWYYGLATIAMLAWIGSYFKMHWRRWITIVAAGVWLLGAALELPHQFVPPVQPISDRSLAVIGDSVTAGIGGEDSAETWPTILAREHQLAVQTLAQAGITTSEALRKVKRETIKAHLIVVEIGGNDLLGSTSSAKFAADLEALLERLQAADRQLVMFELPLPPFCHEYGRIQRTLAAKHSVILIPKRVFLSVIAGGDSTLDSLHLSPQGHRLMAESVWKVIGSAFDRK